MREQEDKELDAFLKTAMKELIPEEVSADFNKKLFQKIAQIEGKKVAHTPLIPKVVSVCIRSFLNWNFGNWLYGKTTSRLLALFNEI
ncbi:hypothetical protein NYZ99_13335 [Maribacter litopenaei]|uniref:Uncharacterized protein n=1 Tax=Maribacter litopenaei TaxID=2976127 RepID=A0ABY5Y5D6_9FLAO|nr:hypothetical protein [Maribacter litopenaei]UWX54036.1 hypothetical protein NYZ99_13335 [Maribacter litopenaei]